MRIFNPQEEMRFAGHPVLGTAFVLAAPLQRGVIELETGAGIVPVTLERDEHGTIVFGRMSQPVPAVEAADEGRVLAALGVDRAELPVELYDNGSRHYVVVLSSESGISSVRGPVGPPAASASAAPAPAAASTGAGEGGGATIGSESKT